MATNIGTLDRIVRIVVGLGLIALALGYLPGYAPNVWGWLGLIPLGTAIVGSCPAYSILGINTCGRS
jgi:hypothetical protein